MCLTDDPVTLHAAYIAVITLTANLGDIPKNLPMMMHIFNGFIDTATPYTKWVTIDAICSAARASGDKFSPYINATMERLNSNRFLEDEEAELRGITMDAVGAFAEAVGKDVFRPFFSDTMKHAFSGITTGNSRLKKCSFLLFSAMARVFEEEFAPYLPGVVSALMANLNQDEGVQGESVGRLRQQTLWVGTDDMCKMILSGSPLRSFLSPGSPTRSLPRKRLLQTPLVDSSDQLVPTSCLTSRIVLSSWSASLHTATAGSGRVLWSHSWRSSGPCMT